MPTHVSNLIGHQFGQLTVIAFAGVEDGHAKWVVRCSCNAESTVWAQHLMSGSKRRCNANCPAKPKRIIFRREISQRGEVETRFQK